MALRIPKAGRIRLLALRDCEGFKREIPTNGENDLLRRGNARGTWQPLFSQLFDLDKARLIVMNRYETVYREAAYMMKFGDPKDKPAALRIMLDTTKHLVSLLGLSSLQDELNKPRLTEETRRLLTRLEGSIPT